MSRHDESPALFAGTVLVALLLAVVPLPGWLQPLWPYWVALVLVYWALERPTSVTLGTAFFVGLCLDVLAASLMGLHALSLVVMVYLVRRFRARLRFFPPWQQALSVFALLVNDRIILLWVITLMGEPAPTWRFWLAPAMGLLLWPWVFLLIDRLRARRRVHRA